MLNDFEFYQGIRKKFEPKISEIIKNGIFRKTRGTSFSKKITVSWHIDCQPHDIKDEWYESKVVCGKYKLYAVNSSHEPTKKEPQRYFDIASWELYQMKNCCGICVSTAAYVDPIYRHEGLGSILNHIRIDIARRLGFGVLLCTDVLSNIPQQKILESNGWKCIHSFLNPRTKNVVGINVIGL